MGSCDKPEQVVTFADMDRLKEHILGQVDRKLDSFIKEIRCNEPTSLGDKHNKYKRGSSNPEEKTVSVNTEANNKHKCKKYKTCT